MVSKMACRSAGGGRPTYKVLSRRPGLSMAGSMISGKAKDRVTLLVFRRTKTFLTGLKIVLFT